MLLAHLAILISTTLTSKSEKQVKVSAEALNGHPQSAIMKFFTAGGLAANLSNSPGKLAEFGLDWVKKVTAFGGTGIPDFNGETFFMERG